MRNKIGLALGGGSGRGVAHLGVLKCLEENDIRIDCISGTSIGALIGALYACGNDFSGIEQIARESVNSDEFKELGFEFFKERGDESLFERLNSYIKKRLTFAKMAVAPFITERESLEKVIKKTLPDVRIEDLPLPFSCTTLDLKSGEDIYIKRGSLQEAVTKSISIAGIFPWWEENGKILVDAGPTANVPVDACRNLGANRVIAVNLSRKLSQKFEPESALSLNFRIDEIAKFRLNKSRAEKADVLIEPDVLSIHWADFSRIDFGIKQGEKSTREKIRAIKNLSRTPFKERIKNLFKKG